jgi:CRISPR-associated protein Cas1
MAATQTVTQGSSVRNSSAESITSGQSIDIVHTPIIPRNGVVTLYGYGIGMKVERGHLLLDDGIGNERRRGRFARVNHGIRRVVVIGADGNVSLAALRWLADQNASFVMLERDGSVLAVTGPVAASDARLRRAQASAEQSDAAVAICSELISRKLIGQENVIRGKLCDAAAADQIARFRKKLGTAKSIAEVRFIESQGSSAYWPAWQNLEITFPKVDLKRVPDHWRVFGSRTSPVSNGARNAANPANAMLNYLYALLEAETRLTIAALGLDPGLGLLHVDSATRDSLACDLMEPVRPSVDGFLIDTVRRSPLKREWFFEQRDGTCRLMADLASGLGETTSRWCVEVAPIAEWFAQAVCSTSPNSKLRGPRTRLTRRRWRESMQRGPIISETPVSAAPKVCPDCGAPVSERRTRCKACAVAISTAALVKGAEAGRSKAVSPEVMTKRRESGRRQNEALQAWNPADHPEWLTNECYMTKVQPLLARVTRPQIMEAIGVSMVYASEIRNGKIVPHKRHWVKLAKLVGVSSGL